MDEKTFRYIDLKKFIDIDTLGPNSRFYYKVQKPVSINMSNFACKIAFYNIDNKLIYHRDKSFAHWLEPWTKIELVKWSREGNLIYFYEYSRNTIYDSVFLNMRDEYCYRIDEMKNDFQLVKSLNLDDRKFSETDILEKLKDSNIQRAELIRDEVTDSNILDKLLRQKKWHPR